MSNPKVPSTWTLRQLAVAVFDDNECTCEVDDDDAQVMSDVDGCETCPCAGDDCWKCASAQALANEPEAGQAASQDALREALIDLAGRIERGEPARVGEGWADELRALAASQWGGQP